MNPFRRLQQEHGCVDIVTHERPDGDAIGSALGLGLALAEADRSLKVRVILPEGIPDRVGFVPGQHLVTQVIPTQRPGLLFVVDCDRYGRTGAYDKEYVQPTMNTVNIDHHPTNQYFGGANYVQTDAASCAEIITQLLHENRIPIGRDAATCLLTGILSDTLGLRTESVSRQTLFWVETLMEAGANLADLQTRIYHQRSLGQLQSWAGALERMATRDQMAWTLIERSDYQILDVSSFDAIGFVELFGTVMHEFPLLVLFVVMPDDSIKVSLRSQKLDVAAVASHFGGGGHARAAGFEINQAQRCGQIPSVVAERYLDQLQLVLFPITARAS